MKLDKTVLANAFALTSAILWTICSAIVALLPKFAWQVTTWWMHGMNLSTLNGWNLTLINFVLGGISLIVSAWATGWVFGWSWETVSKKM